MKVTVHLYSQSKPVVYGDVYNCYTKDGFYCIMLSGENIVHKFPIIHIFRVIEEEKTAG